MCPTSTSGTVKNIISKLAIINPAIKQKLFKMTEQCAEEAPVDEDATSNLTQPGFQTMHGRMSDTTMNVDRGDGQDLGAQDGQQPINPQGNQTIAHGHPGGSQQTTPTGHTNRPGTSELRWSRPG